MSTTIDTATRAQRVLAAYHLDHLSPAGLEALAHVRSRTIARTGEHPRPVDRNAWNHEGGVPGPTAATLERLELLEVQPGNVSTGGSFGGRWAKVHRLTDLGLLVLDVKRARELDAAERAAELRETEAQEHARKAAGLSSADLAATLASDDLAGYLGGHRRALVLEAARRLAGQPGGGLARALGLPGRSHTTGADGVPRDTYTGEELEL